MLWTDVALVKLDEVEEMPAEELEDNTTAELDIAVAELLLLLDEDDWPPGAPMRSPDTKSGLSGVKSKVVPPSTASLR